MDPIKIFGLTSSIMQVAANNDFESFKFHDLRMSNAKPGDTLLVMLMKSFRLLANMQSPLGLSSCIKSLGLQPPTVTKFNFVACQLFLLITLCCCASIAAMANSTCMSTSFALGEVKGAAGIGGKFGVTGAAVPTAGCGPSQAGVTGAPGPAVGCGHTGVAGAAPDAEELDPPTCMCTAALPP